MNRRMENMRDFVTREAGLLHRSICMLNALGSMRLLPTEAQLCESASDKLIQYSNALQLEFKDREMFRWSQAELLRRRAIDLDLLQQTITHSVELLDSPARSVQTCASKLIDLSDELIVVRYKRSAEMRQRVMTLTVSTQIWVLAAALFFGVLHLETTSPLLNMMLCLLTIVTISLSLWTIADMDLPFSSSFHRVKFEQLSIRLLAVQKPTNRSAHNALQSLFKKTKALNALRSAGRFQSKGGRGFLIKSMRPAGHVALATTTRGSARVIPMEPSAPHTAGGGVSGSGACSPPVTGESTGLATGSASSPTPSGSAPRLSARQPTKMELKVCLSDAAEKAGPA